MSHNITQNSKNIYYCTKCGSDSKDLQDKLCKSALHEEELEDKRILHAEELESRRIGIEERKLSFYFIGIVLAIMCIFGFFILIYIGFDRIAVPLQDMIVIAKSAYKECSKGGAG